MNEKILELTRNNPCPAGFSRIFTVDQKTGEIGGMVMQHNMIMDDAPDCIARLTSGDMRYKMAYIYLQFENLTNPTDWPVVPDFTKVEGIEYF